MAKADDLFDPLLDVETFNGLNVQKEAKYLLKSFLRLYSQVFISEEEYWNLVSDSCADDFMVNSNIIGVVLYKFIPSFWKLRVWLIDLSTLLF
jgi:hypothetical protein